MSDKSSNFPDDKTPVVTDQDIKDALNNPIFFTDDEDEFNAEDTLELLKVLDKSIRPPPTGAEHLIANELAVAVVSPSLDKIRHICEAWMILTEDEIKDMGMDEVYPIIRRTYALVHAFMNFSEEFNYDPYGNPREMVKVGLPFTEDEAMDYLHPWATRLPFESYPTTGRLGTIQLELLNSSYMRLFQEAIFVLEETGEMDSRVLQALSDYKARFLYWSMRDGLTKETFKGYVTAFIAEHIPMAMQWFKKIMGKVSPSSFKDAVQSIGASIPR